MRYRKSCGPELEAPPDAPHVVGASCAASRWPGSTDFCTGGKSAANVCDGSGNAATTTDSGLSEAAVVSVAVPAAGSAAVATSALATEAFATTALAIAIACGSSASVALGGPPRRGFGGRRHFGASDRGVRDNGVGHCDCLRFICERGVGGERGCAVLDWHCACVLGAGWIGAS